ncbi:MAG: DJ-1/PfpI family protein [Candidatus Aenigmarchaeota archaeon]|nr:DJ-1/PfpI family protein [Candidatus Aenigmarchaeota archaeon]
MQKGLFGRLFRKKSASATQEEAPAPSKGKKALMVIAPINFRDEECFETKEELENAGIEVTIASTVPGNKIGMLGGTAKADIALDDAKIEDYDALIFVGGSGAQIYFHDENAQKMVQAAYDSGKVIAAICIAPVLFAKTGIMDGKKATVWEDESNLAVLKDSRAMYTGKPVEVDRKIVTANGPKAAREFGKAIAALL